MNPVATSDAAFRGGACPTPEYTIAYTGNYTTSADANELRPLLMDGTLASAGVIAPGLLDIWLTTEHLLWKDDHPTIGALISLEIWARQWIEGNT
jgi:hypothetical protein